MFVSSSFLGISRLAPLCLGVFMERSSSALESLCMMLEVERDPWDGKSWLLFGTLILASRSVSTSSPSFSMFAGSKKTCAL